MRKEEIVIVCAADNHFAEPLTVMIYSVIKTTNSGTLHFWVLDGGIDICKKEKLKIIVKETGNQIDFIEVNEKIFEGYLVSERLTYTAYYRLLIPELLEKSNIKKAIYLDCDLLLNDDIKKLWEIELEGNVLGAIAETCAGCRYVSSPRALKLYKELGIPKNSKYFNSGVLLMDLEEWRRQEITLKVCKYLTENKEYVIYHDQDGLNAILWNSWKELPIDWNVMSYIFITEWEHQEVNMEKKLREKIKKYPKIIHFTGRKKPWKEGCMHPYAALYQQYVRELNML